MRFITYILWAKIMYNRLTMVQWYTYVTFTTYCSLFKVLLLLLLLLLYHNTKGFSLNNGGEFHSKPLSSIYVTGDMSGELCVVNL